MVIQFYIPATGDCFPCCCPVDGDWELTVNGETECAPCRVTVNPIIRYKVADASPVVGVWEIPVGAGPTTFVTVVMQQYEDECVTLSSEPDADVRALITCLAGVVTIQITCTIPGSTEPTEVVVFEGTGRIEEVINNTVNCASGQLPFIITSVTLAHIPPP